MTSTTMEPPVWLIAGCSTDFGREAVARAADFPAEKPKLVVVA